MKGGKATKEVQPNLRKPHLDTEFAFTFVEQLDVDKTLYDQGKSFIDKNEQIKKKKEIV